MKSDQEKKEYVFDAKGESLGRLSTKIVTVLRGKNHPDFVYHKVPSIRVIVNHVSQLNLTTPQKEKTYKRYSGYPGGLKHETREHLIERKGYSDILKKSVLRMLPRNKLRALMMKNLIINE